MKNNIVILGGQGSGKGTQVPAVLDFYKNENILYLTTGGMFRDIMKDNTNVDLKDKVISYMNAGELVPDDIVYEVVANRLKQENDFDGVLFDGIPRKLNQAEKLDEILKDFGGPINKAIYIDVPIEELVKRITGRRNCPKCGEIYHLQFKPPKTPEVCDIDGALLTQRDDDKDSTAVKKRLDIFFEKTTKVLDYYKDRDVLININGNQPIAKVSLEIKEKLENLKM